MCMCIYMCFCVFLPPGNSYLSDSLKCISFGGFIKSSQKMQRNHLIKLEINSWFKKNPNKSKTE